MNPIIIAVDAVLLLKASVKKTIMVPGYTRHDGTFVPPHQKQVNYNPSKEDHHVVAGEGTYSQKKAHKKLSALPGWNDLPAEHQAAHIMSSAQNIQDKETKAAQVSVWKKTALAGKNPSKAMWDSFHGLAKEKQDALMFAVNEAKGGDVGHLQPPKGSDTPSPESKKDEALGAAISHLKEDAQQGDLPLEEKQEDAALVAKLESATDKQGPEKAQEQPAFVPPDDLSGFYDALVSGQVPSNAQMAATIDADKQALAQVMSEAGKVVGHGKLTDLLSHAKAAWEDQSEHAKAVSDMEANGSHYQKEAIKKLKAEHGDKWDAMPHMQKHELATNKYKELQTAASKAAQVSVWKKKMLSGNKPSPAETKAFAELTQSDPEKAKKIKDDVIAAIGIDKAIQLHAFALGSAAKSDKEESATASTASAASDSGAAIKDSTKPEHATEPAKPQMVTIPATVSNFKNTKPGHSKFYSVAVAGNMLVTVYGKIGTKGHKTMKHFATNAEAESAAAKLKSQKLSKGYEAVSEKQTSFDVPKPDKKAEKTAPSATAKIGSNGAQYVKMGDWWTDENGHNTYAKQDKSGVYAALQLVANDPIPLDDIVHYPEQAKAMAVDLAAGGGYDPGKALAMVYGNGGYGPSEGSIKFVNGVSYVLQGGRWHKMSKDEPEAKAQGGTLDALELPDFGNAHNAGSLTTFFNGLKTSAAENGHSAIGIIVTKNYVTVTNNNLWHGKYKLLNPLNHGDKLNDIDKQKLQFILSAKALSGGKPHAALTKWLSEQGFPVSGTKAGAKVAKQAASADSSVPEAPAEPITPSEIKVEAGKPTVTVMDNWAQTGPQKGSNPGGKFKDGAGNEWYCKFPDNKDVVHNELLAAKFYEMLGYRVPSLKLVEKDGKIGIASKFISGLHKGTGEELAKAGAHSGFVADAWLGNWDVVGLSNDNLLMHKDGPVRVDVGGSLLFRAQGGKKGEDFGNKVSELSTLRDSGKNSQSASVFGNISEEDMKAGARRLAMMQPAQIIQMVKIFGPGSEKDKRALAEKLIARRDDIIKQMGVDDPWNKPALDESALAVDPKDLPTAIDFSNYKGTGKPLSSKPHVNEMNTKDDAALIEFAKQGNLTALKNYQYDAVDKETGKPLGKKPITDHPSKDIKEHWAYLVEMLDMIAHPSVKGLDMPPLGGDSLEDIHFGAGFHEFGKNIASIAADKRLGFWMKLAHVGDLSDIKPKKITHMTQSVIAKSKEMFKKLSGTTKAFISEVQKTGWINHIFSEGKSQVSASGNGGSYNGSLSGLAAACYKDAEESPEGTQIYRWMKMPEAMKKQLLKEKPGLVFQNTDSMCCSHNKAWADASHFGSDALLKITYAKGAKALHTFASGAFKSENEVTTLMGQRFVLLSAKNGNPSDPSGIELELLMLPPHEGFIADIESKTTLGKSLLVVLGRFIGGFKWLNK